MLGSRTYWTLCSVGSALASNAGNAGNAGNAEMRSAEKYRKYRWPGWLADTRRGANGHSASSWGEYTAARVAAKTKSGLPVFSLGELLKYGHSKQRQINARQSSACCEDYQMSNGTILSGNETNKDKQMMKDAGDKQLAFRIPEGQGDLGQ